MTRSKKYTEDNSDEPSMEGKRQLRARSTSRSAALLTTTEAYTTKSYSPQERPEQLLDQQDRTVPSRPYFSNYQDRLSVSGFIYSQVASRKWAVWLTTERLCETTTLM